MRTAILALILSASMGGTVNAQPAPTLTAPKLSPQPDIAILSITESDRGGAPNDGDLWRESLTVAAEGRPGVTMTRVIVANTPIPDSVDNRRTFGQPLSAGGRATPPRPGPHRAPPATGS